MTKPIEGWVAWHETQGMEVDFFKESKEAAEREVNAAHRAAGWKVRPVKITFTDEAVINEESDLGMAFVAGAAWRKDDEIAEAIRKDREMIYERLKELDPHAALLLNEIFGEEK